MVPLKRKIISGSLVGILGVYLALLMLQLSYGTIGKQVALKEILLLEEYEINIHFIVISVLSFTSCFLVSLRYLKSMENEDWQLGFILGPIYGGLAGGISGALVGIYALLSKGETGASLEIVLLYLFFTIAGFFYGGIIGGVVGMILTGILGRFSRKLLTKKPD